MGCSRMHIVSWRPLYWLFAWSSPLCTLGMELEHSKLLDVIVISHNKHSVKVVMHFAPFSSLIPEVVKVWEDIHVTETVYRYHRKVLQG